RRKSLAESPRHRFTGVQGVQGEQPEGRDSHVVTHHTTNLPACGLSTAERTGSPVLHTLWSYVPGLYPTYSYFSSTAGHFSYQSSRNKKSVQ
ncbi:hypothetical protein N7450_011330, partial [Penicillium hetheringtonii]